jgi:hypothetical protein
VTVPVVVTPGPLADESEGVTVTVTVAFDRVFDGSVYVSVFAEVFAV